MTLVQAQVLNLPVHVSQDYVGWLMARVQQGLGGHIITLNAEMAMLARQEQPLAHLINSVELVVPDGAGVVWALGLAGIRVARCPGIELVERLITQLPHPKGVYLLGASPGTTDQVVARWQQQFPELQVVGHRHGYFQEAQEAEILAEMVNLSPAVILVGLGVPRQEYLIQRWRSQLPHAIWAGVGGSFDVWAGTKIRAPQWFRDHSLEWLYRLYQEPYRWKRMLALPHFAWTVLRTRF